MAMRRAPRVRYVRWIGAFALAVLLHGVVGWGARDAWAPLTGQTASLRKFEAVYARQVEISAAPVTAARSAPPPVRPKVRRVVPTSAPASSAPEAAEPAASAVAAGAPVEPLESPAESAASAPLPEPPSAIAEAPPPAAPLPEPPVSAPAAASAPAPFEWPRATRVSYRVLGQYRGEVHGNATVEWLRQGDRYQVHLVMSAAAVFTRRMTSEGLITPAGLVPQRYLQTDEFLGGVFSRPRVVDMPLDGPVIRLANGQEVPTPPRVQDTASQFIQFIYLLTTEPALQHPGATVDLALALPRSVRTWRYEAGPIAQVDTPKGPVDTLHMRPAQSAPPGDWSVEIWFAPRLQMLPVQFRLRQSPEVYFDLFIDRMPEQAER